jgi:hypothetical protein
MPAAVLRSLRFLPLFIALFVAFAAAAASAHEGHEAHERHGAPAIVDRSQAAHAAHHSEDSHPSLSDSTCPAGDGGTCCCTDPVAQVPLDHPALAPPSYSALVPLPPLTQRISPLVVNEQRAAHPLLVSAAPRAPPALLR